jgi:hypothetical protein
MSRNTFFVQDCPTCGRRVQIRLAHLGRVVQCLHCEGRFEARDPASFRRAAYDSGPTLMERAEELLASTEPPRPRPR